MTQSYYQSFETLNDPDTMDFDDLPLDFDFDDFTTTEECHSWSNEAPLAESKAYDQAPYLSSTLKDSVARRLPTPDLDFAPLLTDSAAADQVYNQDPLSTSRPPLTESTDIDWAAWTSFTSDGMALDYSPSCPELSMMPSSNSSAFLTPASSTFSPLGDQWQSEPLDISLESLFPEIFQDPEPLAWNENAMIPFDIAGNLQTPDRPSMPTTIFSCRCCPQHFANAALLRKHNEVVHSRANHCLVDDCRWSFQHRKDLVRHGRSKHGTEKEFRCPRLGCEYHASGFDRKDTFRRHLSRTGHGIVGSG